MNRFLFAHFPLLLLLIFSNCQQTLPNPFHLLLSDNGTSGLTNAIPYPSRAKKSVQNQWAKQKKKPIILGWAGLSLYEGYNTFMTKDELNNPSCDCVFTNDTNFESSASAVLFHVRHYFEPLPKSRRPEQLYAMMSIESPHWCYENLEYVPDDYFNVSITYNRDSTIPVPYGQLTPITPLTSPEEIWSAAEISERMSRKKRFALQIVSHCGAPSGRDVLTKQLQELIELDMVGECSGKDCDQKCYEQQMESHFFYLAFENTVCSEYVTEKFWNALRSLTVPVVLCREVVRESGIPDDLYIAADDFDNATALADHLKALHKDKDRYLGYFNWTKFYQKRWVPTVKTSAFCQLCEMVHHQMEEGGEFVGRNYTVKSHKKLWGAQRCRENFVQNDSKTPRKNLNFVIFVFLMYLKPFERFYCLFFREFLIN